MTQPKTDEQPPDPATLEQYSSSGSGPTHYAHGEPTPWRGIVHVAADPEIAERLRVLQNDVFILLALAVATVVLVFFLWREVVTLKEPKS